MQDENLFPGTPAWADRAEPPRNAIEGYSDRPSIAPGSTLELHVRSTGRYRVEVYRLGWYGGLGGRLVVCSPGCRTDRAPARQPVASQPDPQSGRVTAGWAVTDPVGISRAWVTGYYAAVLRRTTGVLAGRGYVLPFIVRPRAGARPRLLVQASVNTWQAYNGWGGKSLYASLSATGVAATQVSFARPYSHISGNTTPLKFELQLVRWLEREGFDASYQTDVDTDRDPDSLLIPAAVIVNGHDEYWSRRMRDAFDRARDAGQDLLFAGADIGYWQIRYTHGHQTIVGYKEQPDPAPDPANRTTQFRNLGRPECELIGVEFDGEDFAHRNRGAGYDVGSGTTFGGWMTGTGLGPNSVLAGTVDYEWDRTVEGCAPRTLEVMFNAPSASPPAQATVYTSAAGGRVVAWGSLGMHNAIDGFTARGFAAPAGPVDPRFQRFTYKMVRDFMSRRPAG